MPILENMTSLPGTPLSRRTRNYNTPQADTSFQMEDMTAELPKTPKKNINERLDLSIDSLQSELAGFTDAFNNWCREKREGMMKDRQEQSEIIFKLKDQLKAKETIEIGKEKQQIDMKFSKRREIRISH